MRNRLLVGVVLGSFAVLGAGTPAVLDASGDLAESQRLVERAELDKRSIALTHALADERDAMVEYVAAGRTSRDGAGVTEAQRARVDRQVTEIRETAPAHVRHALAELPRIRQRAQAGRSSAQDMYEAYTGTITSLQDVSAGVARSLPARAQAGAGPSGATGTAQALPALGRAVEQASSVRGLLRGALAGNGAQPGLTAQAQRANVREQAALADFDEAAGDLARESYAKTVTGADVVLAERYLKRLTDQPYLNTGDRVLNRKRADAALSARINSMRGVQASFAADELRRLERLRDDDVTALELGAALLAGCLLAAVGISVQTARSMARPLSVLTRGSRRLAEDPVGERPVEYRGRNDEFADVVRSLNALRGTVVAVQDRAAEAEADNTYLVRNKDGLTAERDRLRSEYAALKEHVEALSGAVHGTFVNLALRTLGLVERQLGVIEGLEEKESDPERLGTLFKLDHLATRMRRHSENLLLLAGSEHVTAHESGPVPLLDVLRAAISEIERYERVDLGSLPPHVQVSGFAADDLSHLVAELLDNAVSFSPPDAEVRLSGWLLESGEVMLAVEDEGIGITGKRLAALNARLTLPDGQQPPELETAADVQSQDRGPEAGLGMGLYVVARLASRHGLRVQLRERKQGGITAVVAVPSSLLPVRPTPRGAPGDGARVPAPASPAFPGSVAEANSNALPARRVPAGRTVAGSGSGPELEPGTGAHLAAQPEAQPEAPSGPAAVRAPEGETHDPMVAAAEQAVRDSEDALGQVGPDASPPIPAPAAAPEQAADQAAAQAPEKAADQTPDAAPADRPESVPEQHGRVGDAFSDEAARPGTGTEERAGADAVTAAAGTALGTDRAAPAEATVTEAEPTADAAPEAPPQQQFTDKGLPKRRPQQVTAQPQPEQPRQQSANADELRRRLGGFQRGAQHGRRDAAAEMGTSEAAESAADQTGAQSDGGTAEEART